jgi:hypothetical protein
MRPPRTPRAEAACVAPAAWAPQGLEERRRACPRWGFAAGNTFTPQGHAEPTWACLESGGAKLRLARAREPIIASQQGVLFYLSCADVPEMRVALAAAGVVAEPITYPFYAPHREFRIEHPDGPSR